MCSGKWGWGPGEKTREGGIGVISKVKLNKSRPRYRTPSTCRPLFCGRAVGALVPCPTAIKRPTRNFVHRIHLQTTHSDRFLFFIYFKFIDSFWSYHLISLSSSMEINFPITSMCNVRIAIPSCGGCCWDLIFRTAESHKRPQFIRNIRGTRRVIHTQSATHDHNLFVADMSYIHKVPQTTTIYLYVTFEEADMSYIHKELKKNQSTLAEVSSLISWTAAN